MKVNGNARPFIFDTGGRTALTTKACQALQITATDSMKVTDVNNVESYYKTTRIENLTTPDDVINFKNAPSLIINEVKGWECFGVDGIIGSDLFASTIVSIDSQTKNIIVTSAEKPFHSIFTKNAEFHQRRRNANCQCTDRSGQQHHRII